MRKMILSTLEMSGLNFAFKPNEFSFLSFWKPRDEGVCLLAHLVKVIRTLRSAIETSSLLSSNQINYLGLISPSLLTIKGLHHDT